jgi:hypothetical protein
MHFLVLATLLVQSVHAACIGTTGSVGTLMRMSESCADAFPSFGFDADFFDFNFFSAGAGASVRSDTSMRSEVRAASVGGTGLSILNGHGFVKSCVCTSGTCPASPISSTCTGNNTFAISTVANSAPICISFGASLGNADAATATTMSVLLGSQLKVKINNGAEVTYGAGAVKTAGAGTQLVALALINGAGQGVFFSACGPLIVQSGNALSSFATTVGSGTLVPPACNTGVGALGTLIRSSESCAAAFPTFGFHDDFDDIWLGTGFSAQIRSDVTMASYAGTASLDGHGFVKSCKCASASATCPPSAQRALAATCSGTNAYAIATMSNALVCVSFGAPLPATDAAAYVSLPAPGGNPSTIDALSGAQLKVRVNGGAEITFDRGGMKMAGNGTQLVAVALDKNDGQGLFFTACGPFVVQSGRALSSFPAPGRSCRHRRPRLQRRRFRRERRAATPPAALRAQRLAHCYSQACDSSAAMHSQRLDTTTRSSTQSSFAAGRRRPKLPSCRAAC